MKKKASYNVTVTFSPGVIDDKGELLCQAIHQGIPGVESVSVSPVEQLPQETIDALMDSGYPENLPIGPSDVQEWLWEEKGIYIEILRCDEEGRWGSHGFTWELFRTTDYNRPLAIIESTDLPGSPGEARVDAIGYIFRKGVSDLTP